MAEVPYRILVVDDEAVVRDVTILELEGAGFECAGAINGAQALKMLEMSSYDAVLTDLNMPTVNGHALAVKLLEKEDRPVIVVVTVVDEPKLTNDLFTRGVDDIFVKPVNYKLLAVKLSVLLRQKAAASAAKVEQVAS